MYNTIGARTHDRGMHSITPALVSPLFRPDVSSTGISPVYFLALDTRTRICTATLPPRLSFNKNRLQQSIYILVVKT